MASSAGATSRREDINDVRLVHFAVSKMTFRHVPYPRDVDDFGNARRSKRCCHFDYASG